MPSCHERSRKEDYGLFCTRNEHSVREQKNVEHTVNGFLQQVQKENRALPNIEGLAILTIFAPSPQKSQDDPINCTKAIHADFFNHSLDRQQGSDDTQGLHVESLALIVYRSALVSNKASWLWRDWRRINIKLTRVPSNELKKAKALKSPIEATPEILAEGKEIFLEEGDVSPVMVIKEKVMGLQPKISQFNPETSATPSSTNIVRLVK